MIHNATRGGSLREVKDIDRAARLVPLEQFGKSVDAPASKLMTKKKHHQTERIALVDGVLRVVRK